MKRSRFLPLLVAGTVSVLGALVPSGLGATAAPSLGASEVVITTGLAPTRGVGDRAAAAARPNIVLVMTDDQNRNEVRWMPKVRQLLGSRGVTFRKALSPAPLCCPARSMVVTGQYGQNNGVRYNAGPFGGFAVLRDKQNTLARWLQAAGYHTALVGKYLNGYEGSNTPPQEGWTRWNPSIRNIYEYENTVFLEGDGTRTFPGNTTPVIGDYSVEDVRAFAAQPEPFFLWVSHVAPHGATYRSEGTASVTWGAAKPTAEHAGVLGDVVSPALRKPSFNVVTPPPNPYPVLSSWPLSRPDLQAYFTARIRTLQDVDDEVERLVATLRETGELDNTYIFFVSDNGHLLGEHRILAKNVLYREALAVPMLVRVPGATAGWTSDVPVTTVDLAPTILELAGATAGRTIDGQSFAPVLRRQPMRWRDTQLVQTGGDRTVGPEPGWTSRGVWTARYTYIRRSVDGVEFLFDRRRYPYEMVNVATKASYRPILSELRRRRQALVNCAGATCARSFGAVPPHP
jgi:arylsulfatase A-like enzyme